MNKKHFTNEDFYKFLRDNHVKTSWMELNDKGFVKNIHITTTKTKTFTNDTGIGVFIELFEHHLTKYFKEHKTEINCRVYYLADRFELLKLHYDGVKLIMYYDESLF